MKVRFLSTVCVGLAILALLAPMAGLEALAAPGAHPDAAPEAQDTTLPMVALTADGIVRAWPDSGADTVGSIPARSSVPVSGRLVDFTWWQIPYPTGPGGYGWVAATVVLPNSAAASVPVIQVIMPTPVPVQPTATPTPPPAPTCTLDAKFVTDVTIPDGLAVPPAQSAHKVWRLQNTGTCPWDSGTLLKFIGGFQMSAPLTVTFPATPPGGTVDIGTTMYAPSQPGVYQGNWQLEDYGTNFFGPKITCVIKVISPAPQTPATPVPPPPKPSSPAGASVNFWTDTNRVKAGRCTTIHWDVKNVQAVYLDYKGKRRGVSGQGSQSVCPSSDGKTYNLIIVRRDGGQESRTVRIDVSSPPAVQISFSASPNSIFQTSALDGCSMVSWRVKNAKRIQYNNGSKWRDVGGDDERRECPRKTTTYRLRVTDQGGGTKEKSTKVDVHWGGDIGIMN
jgi:hypothetical protein